jgi:hypothetical protein
MNAVFALCSKPCPALIRAFHDNVKVKTCKYLSFDTVLGLMNCTSGNQKVEFNLVNKCLYRIANSDNARSTEVSHCQLFAGVPWMQVYRSTFLRCFQCPAIQNSLNFREYVKALETELQTERFHISGHRNITFIKTTQVTEKTECLLSRNLDLKLSQQKINFPHCGDNWIELTLLSKKMLTQFEINQNMQDCHYVISGRQKRHHPFTLLFEIDLKNSGTVSLQNKGFFKTWKISCSGKNTWQFGEIELLDMPADEINAAGESSDDNNSEEESSSSDDDSDD